MEKEVEFMEYLLKESGYDSRLYSDKDYWLGMADVRNLFQLSIDSNDSSSKH